MRPGSTGSCKSRSTSAPSRPRCAGSAPRVGSDERREDSRGRRHAAESAAARGPARQGWLRRRDRQLRRRSAAADRRTPAAPAAPRHRRPEHGRLRADAAAPAEPEESVSLLRAYQSALGEEEMRHSGTLEHFAGDGLMVWFNDPQPVEGHQLKAVQMAIAMRDRFNALAAGWRKKGYELGFGVGIATGYATLARIRFEGRFDYGAVGMVVILASPLSSAAVAGP